MSDFHIDPSSVLDEMEKRIVDARLLRETYRAGGNGSKTAVKKLRKITYQIGILGKHFRDLTNAKDAGKRKHTINAFSAKWAKVIAPSRRTRATKTESANKTEA